MSRHLSQNALASVATVVPAPTEGSLGLPPILFAATAGGYLLFLAILDATFMNPGLWVPFAIFLVYLAMAAGVPALWPLVARGDAPSCPTWTAFRRDGIAIATGRLRAGVARVQVLILPGLVVLWSLAVALIVAAL